MMMFLIFGMAYNVQARLLLQVWWAQTYLSLLVSRSALCVCVNAGQQLASIQH